MSTSEAQTSSDMSNEMDSLLLLAAVGPDGRVECPLCQERIATGVAGLANVRRHMEGERCKKQAKRNRENQNKSKQQNLVKSYFTAPKKVPSTVPQPPTIHSTTTVCSQSSSSTPAPKSVSETISETTTMHAHEGIDSPATLDPSPTFCKDAMSCLTAFKARVVALERDPSIPEAGINHELAAFSGDPVGCVQDGEDAWERWDGPLNTLLQKEPSELRKLVVRGNRGLIGLHNFLLYLVVNHGIAGGLIEGKISRLTKAIDDV